MIRIKRIYTQKDKSDGFRILVDRLWPRGLTKEAASIDLWMKEISPSVILWEYFKHEEGKFEEFKKKYTLELDGKRDFIKKIFEIEKENTDITLLYSAKDEQHNNAVVLKDYLEQFKSTN